MERRLDFGKGVMQVLYRLSFWLAPRYEESRKERRRWMDMEDLAQVAVMRMHRWLERNPSDLETLRTQTRTDEAYRFVVQTLIRQGKAGIRAILGLDALRKDGTLKPAEKHVAIDKARDERGQYDRRSFMGDGNAPDPELVVIAKDELKHVLAAAERLNPQQKVVMTHRWGLGTVPKTLETTGEFIGVGKERVRQIQKKAHQMLRYYGALEVVDPDDANAHVDDLIELALRGYGRQEDELLAA